MAYFKYIPYLFLILSVFFAWESVSKYSEGGDGLPQLLLAVAGVVYFFIRRKMYSRYNPKK